MSSIPTGGALPAHLQPTPGHKSADVASPRPAPEEQPADPVGAPSDQLDLSPGATTRAGIAARLAAIYSSVVGSAEAADNQRAFDPGALLSGRLERAAAAPTGEAATATAEAFEADADADADADAAGRETLSQEEQQEVRKLKQRDEEVRTHEAAHMAAGGSMVSGGPSYTFATGPDGKRYAVGGEVSISVPEGRTPEETIQNARQAQRAALAPADPSPQDRRVAAKAAQMAAKAQQEKQEPQTTPGEQSEEERAGEDVEPR